MEPHGARANGPVQRATSRVLVVDDSTFMRSRIRRKLVGAGMEIVAEAKDGHEAVELYRQTRPDLVTMDLTMRGEDGLSAAKSILRTDPDAKIVLFSIVDDGAVVDEARQCGIKECVHKSRMDDLVERLEHLAREG